jgi:hypothetical protein
MSPRTGVSGSRTRVGIDSLTLVATTEKVAANVSERIAGSGGIDSLTLVATLAR